MRRQLFPTRIPWRRRVSLPIGIGALIAGAIGYFLIPFPVVFFLMSSGLCERDEAIWTGALTAPVGALSIYLAFLGFDCPLRTLGARLGVRRLKWQDLLWSLLGFCVILTGSIQLNFIWGRILKLLKVSHIEKQNLLEMAEKTGWGSFFAMGAVVIILVPISEEVFFRRGLYGVLRPLGAWTALVVTSLLFSAVHFFLLGFPSLFLMGLVFQLVYLKTRNLAAAITTHALVNLLAMFGAFLVRLGVPVE